MSVETVNAMAGNRNPANPATVLIVGAGPTGMMAALELTRFGIPVRLIERSAEPATTSRAIGVQARTLELFAQRGLVAPMLEKGNRGIAGSIYGAGERIFRLEFANNGSDYGYLLFISQAETEAILRGALEARGVQIEREVELAGIAQLARDEGVRAFLRKAQDEIEEFDCAYLIDSEGAHSVCRETLGLTFAGKTRDEDYALGDFYLDGELPSTDFHIFSSQHGFLGLFPMGNARFRMIASHPLSEPNAQRPPSLDELQRIYDQRSHIPARLRDMSWSSWFRINSRMVNRLRVGRIFLGGDAAHIHSPAGAQGMNTGLQDMVNLGWKLAMVMRGEADARLLDTYEEDRLPVIRDVLSRTEGLTDAIGSENAAVRSVFRHVAPWIVGTAFAQETSTQRMSQLSLGYRESSLSKTDSAAGHLKAGDRVPNLPVKLSDGTSPARAARLFEALSTDDNPDRFTLLFLQPKDAAAAHRNVRERLAAWRPRLAAFDVVPEPGAAEAFADVFGKHAAMVLVRPDGYAAFTAGEDSFPALVKYLETWLPGMQRNSAASPAERHVA
ncbi:FAD-dependent monooxygenase [Silvibacterium sp.]|uniref:FAD-dependent monooxygenase n=1 Tax=Silvibacterium sp. TaxID=1964179 RepID=UPI0039E3AA97